MEFKRPKSLTSVVTEHVRKLIINGVLPLGASISERSIASELQVSKTPVREAFAQLKNEGLITIKPQSGVRVFTLSAREVRDICVFRNVLETTAIVQALEAHPDELYDELNRIASLMENAQNSKNVKEYLALDDQFHAAIFRYCDNTYLRDSYARYAGKIAALRTHLATKPDHTSLSYAEHIELVQAVKNGDADILRNVLEKHIGRTQDTYQIGVEDIAAADAPDEMKPAS